MRAIFESARLVVGLTIVLVLIYLFYWIKPAQVEENDVTMMPNIGPKQRLYFSRSVQAVEDLKPGDVIIYFGLDPQERQRKDYISRVIAMPGQRVSVISGKLLIDSQPPMGALDQPGQIPSDVPEFMVPREHIFVLYDKRDDDKRQIWQRLVHVSHVEGKRLQRN